MTHDSTGRPAPQADWRDRIDRKKRAPPNSAVFVFSIDPIAQRRFATPVESFTVGVEIAARRRHAS